VIEQRGLIKRCGSKLAVDGLTFDTADRRRRDRNAFEVLPRRWVVERTLAWASTGAPPATTSTYPPATKP
jgi:transposase